MSKSIFKKVLLAAALGTLVSGTALAAVSARLGHAMPESHPQAVAMNKFVELAAKYTNDNVQIKAFHTATLGSDEKQLQAVQSGTQEFYIGTLAPFSTRIKEVQVWDLPFMFANTKEVYALLDGESSKKIFEKLEPAGVVGLMWTGMGFRDLSNSKRPVTKLEEIEGLKIRVMANPVALETWKTLGANAVPMAFSEVFTALEIKAIDGQENPLQHMYSNKMQEVQKYISLTNHVYTPVALIVSNKFWSTLRRRRQGRHPESRRRSQTPAAPAARRRRQGRDRQIQGSRRPGRRRPAGRTDQDPGQGQTGGRQIRPADRRRLHQRLLRRNRQGARREVSG